MANTNDSFEVPLDKLRWRCPPESLTFETPAAANTNLNLIGQERAVQAIKLGLQVRAPGYNIYVGGPPGTGKATITQALLNERKGKGPTPPDICYVHNFQRPEAPQLIFLPPGRGTALAQAMEELCASIRKSISPNNNGGPKSSAASKRPSSRQNLETLKTFAQNRLAELQKQFTEPGAGSYLERVQAFLLNTLARWQDREPRSQLEAPALLECQVNVLVDNSATAGAPVIVETAPTFNNLFGTIGRRQNRDGNWHSDFTQIKAGALARANGGYLLLNVSDALGEPGVWRMLKRTLRHHRLEIQPYDPLAPNLMAAMRPEPIPLDLKVVVIADLDEYYHLNRHDPYFREIFKVRADFDASMSNEVKAHRQYAGLIAKISATEGLLPFDHSAVAAVIEHGVGLAGTHNKITARFGVITDLLREANAIAVENGKLEVRAEEVQHAVEKRFFLQRLAEDRLFERIRHGRLMLDVDGKRIGQVNALMVQNYLDYSYGYPCRLTAMVGMGSAGIINIERDADLSGKTHNKSVAIVAGFLRGKYAQDKPLSMTASIAFEQSYTNIDGDSASVAEVCAILSALSGLPLRQDLAVTGSINQKGEVQGIGAVNEKIEGFFNVCQMKGLTGSQGVLIPRQNSQDLMLRQEVIAAVAAGNFHIHAIATIDAALELLTGVPAGEKDADGKLPEGSVHFKVDQRLRELNKEKKDNKSLDDKKEEKPDAEKKTAVKPA